MAPLTRNPIEAGTDSGKTHIQCLENGFADGKPPPRSPLATCRSKCHHYPGKQNYSCPNFLRHPLCPTHPPLQALQCTCPCHAHRSGGKKASLLATPEVLHITSVGLKHHTVLMVAYSRYQARRASDCGDLEHDSSLRPLWSDQAQPLLPKFRSSSLLAPGYV